MGSNKIAKYYLRVYTHKKPSVKKWLQIIQGSVSQDFYNPYSLNDSEYYQLEDWMPKKDFQEAIKGKFKNIALQLVAWHLFNPSSPIDEINKIAPDDLLFLTKKAFMVDFSVLGIKKQDAITFIENKYPSLLQELIKERDSLFPKKVFLLKRVYSSLQGKYQNYKKNKDLDEVVNRLKDFKKYES